LWTVVCGNTVPPGIETGTLAILTLTEKRGMKLRQSLLLEFPVAEYERRINKLLASMDRDNIDAIIFNSKDNNNYFTGFQSIVWSSNVSTPGALIITRNGDAVLVSTVNNKATAEVTSCVEEVEYYDPKNKNYTFAAAIYDVIKKKGFANSRIGLEIGVGLKMHFNYKDLMDLLVQLSSCEIVEIGDIVWECRMVKSEYEIEYMRRVCDLTARAFNSCLQEAYYGITEMELRRKIEVKMLQLGAEELYGLGLRAGQERYTQGNCPPCDRPIKTGEIILVDGGSIYKGYYCDIIREAIIGQPNAIQREMFDIAAEAAVEGIHKMKPGVLISDVAKAVRDLVGKTKYDHLHVTKNGCGHSIGLNVHEYPMLSIDTDVVLQPGMIFAIEPYILDPEHGSMGIEENVLITETGCEILSHTSHDLIII
jgi:Xaa-Pro aminopeptidase